MDLTSVPRELAGPLATVAALIFLWKLAGEGIKTWRDGRMVGKAPVTPYDALAARVTTLESRDADKTKRIGELEEELLRVRISVHRLAAVLTREVAQVLAWIAGGARPPAPDAEIALIRSVIADLEHTAPTSKEDA